MLDDAAEIGTLDPLLWRAWAYIFSSSYRARRHARWAEKGFLYATVDITLSLIVFVIEVLVILWLLKLLVGAFFGSA